MRYARLLIFFLFFSFASKAAQGGGEIFYDDLGGGHYRVTLKLYRDCFNNPTAFDNPALIGVYDASGNYVDSLRIPFTSSALVPPAVNNPCFTPPATVCLDVATYTANITLAPKTGGYYLVYQRCCRGASVLNLSNPTSTGATYMEHIPGPEIVGTNSSPHFSVNPFTFLCSGVAMNFNFSATDPDGDSLVYQFCAPYAGLDACCPILISQPPNTGDPACVNPPATCPSHGNPPPYNPVSYVAPYGGGFPMSSNPAIQINSSNGHLSGVPNIPGQWVMCICVKEYRNGIYIGTHSGDFLINVINCPTLIQSSIQPQGALCTGMTINFTNASTGATGYSWNFGDPTTLADTSNSANPSYTFPDTGKYVVTLIAHGTSAGCNDTSTEIFYVYPVLSPNFVPPAPQCIVGNSYSFTAGGQYASYSTLSWNFSSLATPSVSTQQNPSGISYTQYGYFPVTLTVQQKSCSKSFTDTVQVYPFTTTSFKEDTFKGCQPLKVAFTNTSVYGGATYFTWYFGNGDSLVAVNPTYTYQDTGMFNITLVGTTTVGCIGSSTVTANGLVTIYPGPKAGFVVTPTSTGIYDPNFSLTDTSKNVTVQTVNMGDGNIFTSMPSHYSYSGDGSFTITQIALSGNGCTDTARHTITIDPDFTFYVPNSFSPNKDIHNEMFHVYSYGITDYSISIYDRWGREVFGSQNPEEGWDGTYKGEKCPEDIYVYKIEFTPLTDPYPHKLTGAIHLIR